MYRAALLKEKKEKKEIVKKEVKNENKNLVRLYYAECSVMDEMPEIECEDLKADLFVAIQSEDIDSIHSLIEKGADVNDFLTYREGNTQLDNSPLWYAIDKLDNDRGKFTYRMINKDCGIEYSKPAKYNKFYEVIECLVNYGADVNSFGYDFGKETFFNKLLNIFYYAKKGDKKLEICFHVFKLLLENGANPNQTTRMFPKLPIEQIFSNLGGHKYGLQRKMIYLLLQYGSKLPEKKYCDKDFFSDCVLAWPDLLTFYCVQQKLNYCVF